MKLPVFSLVLVLNASAFLAGGSLAQTPKKPLLTSRPATIHAPQSQWGTVMRALSSSPASVPAVARREGPPLRDGDSVLFRFRAPADAAKVFLAGTFNGYAANSNGAISSDLFAMKAAGNGYFYKRVHLEPQTYNYKYVVLDKGGRFNWVSDPQAKAADQDGNSVLDFAGLQRLESPRDVALSGRALKPFAPLVAPISASKTLDVRAQNVWVRPDQSNTLLLDLGNEAKGADLKVDILTPFGTGVYSVAIKAKGGENRVTIPALKREGGYLARVRLNRVGKNLAAGETVLSVAKNIADDLRYGFYATYKDAQETSANYAAKAALLAKFHLNSVEYYDYFPGHGYYAPREENYAFEPFGIALNARDVVRKIEAGHARNILSIAYVATYAASESVYRRYPFPMTNEQGVPKIFNGQVMTEAEADAQKKPKWFWIMDVSGGSPWHRYILDEFGRTLDNKPGDLVSFDGFELDTYGDAADAKFYAKNSPRNGDLLTDVLRDFVRDVQIKTRQIKPHGLVSFNSINEFGIEKMSDVTDFGFLEIWSGYTQNLEDLVDISFRRRATLSSKRVVLKLYPADMTPKQTTWPAATMRRVLGATLTGAGSLMVAGEPDEKSGRIHGLNSLFYPDHQPLSPEAERVLRDYYAFDALMLGVTHGRDVQNTGLENPIPGCITRTYAAPAKKLMVVQILNVQGERKWTANTPASAPRKNLGIALDLPGAAAPQSVLFASPDNPALQLPVKLDFEIKNGKLRAQLPELLGYGALILRY